MIKKMETWMVQCEVDQIHVMVVVEVEWQLQLKMVVVMMMGVDVVHRVMYYYGELSMMMMVVVVARVMHWAMVVAADFVWQIW